MTGSTSLYKYVSIDGLRQILLGSLRFTQPSAFNDPFELLPEIVIPDGEPERQLSVQFDIVGERRHPPVGEVVDIPEGYNSSDPTSRDIVNQLNNLIGILCLSRTSGSLLMWSHYADQYAGSVVEFDGSHEFFAHLIEVEYRPLRPRKHLSMYVAGEPIPVSELCVKSDQWAYEREVRIIRLLSECEKARNADGRNFPVYTQRIPIEAIKSVIMGERMPVPAQREVFGRIYNTKIALSLAAVSHSGYEFRREIVKYAVPISQISPSISPRTAHIFAELDSQLGELARWMIRKHPLSRIVNKPI